MESRNLKIVTKRVETDEFLIELQAKLKLDERKQRSELEQKEKDANHRRFLDKVLVFAALIIVAACIYVSLFSGLPPKEKEQANYVIGLVVVAIVTHLLGKRPDKKEAS